MGAGVATDAAPEGASTGSMRRSMRSTGSSGSASASLSTTNSTSDCSSTSCDACDALAAETARRRSASAYCATSAALSASIASWSAHEIIAATAARGGAAPTEGSSDVVRFCFCALRFCFCFCRLLGPSFDAASAAARACGASAGDESS